MSDQPATPPLPVRGGVRRSRAARRAMLLRLDPADHLAVAEWARAIGQPRTEVVRRAIRGLGGSPQPWTPPAPMPALVDAATLSTLRQAAGLVYSKAKSAASQAEVDGALRALTAAAEAISAAIGRRP